MAPFGERSPAPIASHSSRRALELSERLAARGAKMYGAWWCSHCAGQKETLGAEAMGEGGFYVECSPDGAGAQNERCVAAGVKGYPTWEVGGQLFPGEKDLSELEEMLSSAK